MKRKTNVADWPKFEAVRFPHMGNVDQISATAPVYTVELLPDGSYSHWMICADVYFDFTDASCPEDMRANFVKPPKKSRPLALKDEKLHREVIVVPGPLASADDVLKALQLISDHIRAEGLLIDENGGDPLYERVSKDG